MRLRRGGFYRALERARTFDDEDGNRAILLPPDLVANPEFALLSPHAHGVAGGVLFAVDQDTLAEMVADTLAAINAGAEETETFRRRVAILRKLVGPERWAEAEAAFELARSLVHPPHGPMQ